MYDKSQMMRGTLEGCILKIISVETTYGYEIVMKLQDFGFEDMKEGTIYPLLVRLEKKKMISSEFRPSPLENDFFRISSIPSWTKQEVLFPHRSRRGTIKRV